MSDWIAIDKDPSFALAHAALADTYLSIGIVGARPPREVMPLAATAADRALMLDDRLAEAHTSRAAVSLWFEWDRAGAARGLQRAFAVNENSAFAHQIYAYYLAGQERFSEATAEMRRALELDPLSLLINTDLALMYAFVQQWDQTIEQVNRALALDPNYQRATSWLQMASELSGREREAFELRKTVAIRQGRTELVQELERAFAKDGLRGLLEVQLGRNLAASKTRQPVHPRSRLRTAGQKRRGVLLVGEILRAARSVHGATEDRAASSLASLRSAIHGLGPPRGRAVAGGVALT